jgi:hypothetical protein
MDFYLIKNCQVIDMVTEQVQEKEILVEKGVIKKIESPGIIKCENTYDLNGKTILPGFIDSHMHLIPSCIDQYAINLENAKSIEEILELIKTHREKNPETNMIIGSRLTEFSLEEKRLPTKEDLDQVAKDIPVFLSSIEFHTATVNSYVLHQLNLPLSLEKIIRDENDHPTGQMVNNASIIARKKMYEMFSEKNLKQAFEKVYQNIVKNGITSLIAIEGGYLFHNKHVDFLVKNKLDYPIDIDILYSTTDVNKVKVLGLNKIGGDIFLDGSFRSRNAKISDSYSDAPGETGKLFFSQEEIEDLIETCILENLQISVHAVGNIGIKTLIDAYENVYKKYPSKDYRHKIEHFELPDMEDIPRVKSLGLVLTMHPSYENFFRADGGMYDQRLGKERSLKTNPLRQVFDAGITVAGGSDSHILPANPLLGVHSAVNHPNEKSRLTIFEALKMYTINGAYGNKEEHLKGTIQEGKLADFAVLSDNPLTSDPEELKNISVEQTIKNGKIIFSKDDQ